MTKIRTVTADGASTGEEMTVWRLVNPASGANNIEPSFSGTGTYAVLPICYNGVDQTTPEENVTSATVTNTTNIVSLTVSTSNSWAACASRSNGNVTQNTGTTFRPDNTNMMFGDSNGAVSAGSYSIGWNSTNSGTVVAYAIRPAASSSSSVKTVNGLAKASVKTVNGLAIASVKSINGLA